MELNPEENTKTLKEESSSEHPLKKLLRDNQSENAKETIYCIIKKFHLLVLEARKDIIIDFLKTIPSFKNLTYKSLKRIFDRSTQMKMKRGQTLI